MFADNKRYSYSSCEVFLQEILELKEIGGNRVSEIVIHLIRVNSTSVLIKNLSARESHYLTEKRRKTEERNFSLCERRSKETTKFQRQYSSFECKQSDFRMNSSRSLLIRPFFTKIHPCQTDVSCISRRKSASSLLSHSLNHLWLRCTHAYISRIYRYYIAVGFSPFFVLGTICKKLLAWLAHRRHHWLTWLLRNINKIML